MNMNNGTIFSEGYVTLPLTDYNALLAKVESVDSMVSVKNGWSDTIEVDVNKATIFSVAKRKYSEYCRLNYIPEDSYRLVEFADFYFNVATLANKKPTEDKQ